MSTVRIGIIGLGNMGSHHATYMDQVAGCRLAAICDLDPARVERAAAKSPNAKTFSGHREMLDSGEVDAVLIATPHYDHPPIAIDAFERGLHVLCEKPVAVTVGAARRLNEEYAKYSGKLKFGAMFNQRTRPFYKKLRELILAGELGEISRITWTVTDWFRTWTYYASGGWRATWAGEGGGVLLNQCPHNLDLLWWLTGGMKPSRVTAVAFIAKKHPIEVEDEVSAILEYPNGAVGHFITTTGEAPGISRLEIAGNRGIIIAEDDSLKFRRLRSSSDDELRNSPLSFAQPERWDIEVPVKPEAEGHRVVTERFVQAILNGGPLVAEAIDGVHGLEIGNAMLMAGLTRTPVELPMNAEAYEAFLKDLIRKHGGRKQLSETAPSKTQVDMSGTF